MKKILLLLFVPLMLSCEPSAVGEGRDAYKAYFNKVLKDPSSFKVYEEKYSIDPSSDVKVDWTLDYGARNELGGMVRKNINFSTISTSIWIDGTMYKYNDLK